VLLSPEAKAKAWSKFFMKPLLWMASRFGYLEFTNSEVRDKVSLFLRSRWFKPPLDGMLMTALMYKAVTVSGEPRSPTASLLPTGQNLDLFVTMTDYYGYLERVQIHSPTLIHEIEHRQLLRFKYRRYANNEVVSDFTLDNAAALAFAARATSSFPGVFPPAQIAEMDQLLEERGEEWPNREEFIVENFERYIRADLDPTHASFIDGAVLNNHPFHEAISAIKGRPAYREVDRRLVYIDPNPAPVRAIKYRKVPGFFLTLKGALADIPANQPVSDELRWVYDYNVEARAFRSVIEGAGGVLWVVVSDTITEKLDQKIAPDQIKHWREQINSRAARDAGFAYEGYARLKLASVRNFVTRIILEIGGIPARSPAARAVNEIIEAWAERRGIVYDRGGHDAVLRENSGTETLPPWARFFLSFDVDYRKRRLNFLIEAQNRLYHMLDEDRYQGLEASVVDGLKREYYRKLDVLQRREEAKFYSVGAHGLVNELFGLDPDEDDAKDFDAFAKRFVDKNHEKIDRLIEMLAKEIDLAASTRDLDDLMASIDPAKWTPEAHREVLINYLGFPFWDVLTFSVANANGAGEIQEILIDRISPQDVHTLKGFDRVESLRGIGFGHFAAFLSRAYRENDYLLGRLHSIDRLIDIVCDSAEIETVSPEILRVKKNAFTRVLNVEVQHLTHSADLLRDLRRCVESIGTD
jgi:patatin-related protein